MGRPSIEEEDALTRDILDAALQEFRRNGFSGASIERIAAAANVTRVAVYRRYAGKEALFADVTLNQIALLENLAESVSSNAENPLDALRKTTHAYVEFVLSPVSIDLQRIIVAEAERFPEFAKRLGSPLPVDLAVRVDRCIVAAQAAGQLEPGPASLWRDVLLRLVVEGMRWQALVGFGRWTPEEISDHVASMWPLFLKVAGRPQPAGDPPPT